MFEWGKAKVLSKKPRRTFISLKPGVGFNVIHHDLDEQATFPTVLPPCQSNEKTHSVPCWPSVIRRACVQSWVLLLFTVNSETLSGL